MPTNYKVLLIEDDELDQMAFKRYLNTEKLPYEYEIASSISEALSFYVCHFSLFLYSLHLSSILGV